jgi:acyl-CoA reductase-like NAD-dependent aldehyde dehydrogenase
MTREPTEMELMVATAMCDCDHNEWRKGTPEQRASYIRLARAAIRAMRDCTEQMVAQAQTRYEADLKGVERTIIGCLWMEMIDAASPPDEP